MSAEAQGRPAAGPGASEGAAGFGSGKTTEVARFPELEGRSLEGRRLILPANFEPGLNVVAVAFHRHHQRDVDTWIEDFETLEAGIGASAWEIPTISGRWGPARRFIDGGMASAIKDARTRARTVTVYGNTSRVTRALGLPDRDQIAVVLCEPSGRVHFMARGPRSDRAARELSAAAAELGNGPLRADS